MSSMGQRSCFLPQFEPLDLVLTAVMVIYMYGAIRLRSKV